MKTLIRTNPPERKIVALRRKQNGSLLFRNRHDTLTTVLQGTEDSCYQGTGVFEELCKNNGNIYDAIYEGDTVEIQF